MTKENIQEITLFCLSAIVLGWLVASPMWTSGEGLKTVGSTFYFIAFMWTPALTALGFYFWQRKGLKTGFKSFFNFQLGSRWGPHWVLHVVIWPVFAFATPFVASALGIFELDLSFSGFKALVMAQIQDLGGPTIDPFADVPVEAVVAIQFASSFTAAFVNFPVVIGEELGWRGFLLPRLRSLGFWKANIFLGTVWGLWHAPLILLGYNYPSAPVQGLFFMCGFCIVIGTLINWSSWVTGSVWPAAFGHGAINGSAGAIVLFQAEGHSFDSRWAGMTGISGWLLPIVFIIVLMLLKKLPGTAATETKKDDNAVGKSD
jgi:membrane protease YdiL (CAAX protease family)